MRTIKDFVSNRADLTKSPQPIGLVHRTCFCRTVYFLYSRALEHHPETREAGGGRHLLIFMKIRRIQLCCRHRCSDSFTQQVNAS